MLLVIKLVTFGLLRPLEVLQTTIQGVAKGNYSPTSYEGLQTDEIHGLIGAFNRMAQELEANQEHSALQARKIAATRHRSPQASLMNSTILSTTFL